MLGMRLGGVALALGLIAACGIRPSGQPANAETGVSASPPPAVVAQAPRRHRLWPESRPSR